MTIHDELLICENCRNWIYANEPFYRMAHLFHANRDGTIEWAWTHIHVNHCERPILLEVA